MNAALVVLDGWGLSEGHLDAIRAGERTDPPADVRDAVWAAETPTADALFERGAFGTLTTWGRGVGLPEGQMGNSEVGHLTIGAGRVVFQEYTRIEDAIAAGELGGNVAIAGALEHADASDGRLHLAGLVSDGGVHADQRHMHALVELAAERGVEAVTHAFTDGRDTSPRSGEGYLATYEEVVERAGTGDVATVSGRYYAMDRDRNWERTKRAFDAVVERTADHEAGSAVAAVRDSYARGDTDEFVEPTLVAGGPPLEEGDALLFCNFRADRARQLTRMLADIRPEGWAFDTDPPAARVVTMTEYDETFDLPVAFEPRQPERTLGEVLAGTGRTQLRIAESEKYAHVTYFLNGGREVEFEGEVRHIVESPDVPTYDLRPEMSAAAVTDTAVDAIAADDPDVLVLNYANPDMVGHTGDFDAAVEAVEAVDAALGRLLDCLAERGAHQFVTADHGNADEMGTPEEPHTAHTFNPVPFAYRSPAGDDGGYRVREGGELSDIAPTLLARIGVPVPDAMTGSDLLVE